MDLLDELADVEFKANIRNVLGALGLKSVDKVYKANEELYRSARKACEKMIGDCIRKKERLLEIIKNRDCLKRVDDRIYEDIKVVIPYIINIQERELQNAGKEIDYIDLLVKLEYICSSYFVPSDNKTSYCSIGYCPNTKNDNTLLILPFLRMRLGINESSRGTSYIQLIHEIFHIMDAPILTQNCKQGIMFGKQAAAFYKKDGNQYLVYLNEGNTVRRTWLVVEEMIKNGHKFSKNYKEANYIGYRHAADKISELLRNNKELYKAVYGEEKNLKKFMEENDKFSLFEEEKLISEKYFRLLS